MAELVSILIPAYRAEAFIGETIRFALEQTWPNKEIIVVDDGSPDRTFEVAKRFASGSVKVLQQENGGAPSARNRALTLAQGTYIQWLDADDLIHPDKLRLQLEGAESGLTSRTVLTSAWGKFYSRVDRAVFVPDPLWRDHAPIDWILTKFTYNVWMNPAVWLVSRSLTDIAGPWDSALARSGDDDGEYICRVIAHSDGIRFVRNARAYYRIGNIGGLSWGMGRSSEALRSLVLSLRATVGHLLRLEDTARTREASFRYLSAFAHHFYGFDRQLFDELNHVACEIGFELKPPHASWKYRPVERVAGPEFTKTLMVNWRKTKALFYCELERRFGIRTAG
jgi:glycosyltransferase involved in cell wall biosynthesis